MKRVRFFAVATIFFIALAAFAQQSASSAAEQDHATTSKPVETAEGHLKLLSEKLDLTGEQQEKLRPIIQNMLDESQKILNDQSLSDEQRHEKKRAQHEKADRQARSFLNDEQKKKLDELEAQHSAGNKAGAQH